MEVAVIEDTGCVLVTVKVDADWIVVVVDVEVAVAKIPNANQHVAWCFKPPKTYLSRSKQIELLSK